MITLALVANMNSMLVKLVCVKTAHRALTMASVTLVFVQKGKSFIDNHQNEH